MYDRNIRGLFVGGALLAVVGCGAAQPGLAEVSTPPAAPGAAGHVPLKVVLFPYIPDSSGDAYQRLIQSLKVGYDLSPQHAPGVDLQIVIDPAIDLYGYAPGGALDKLLGTGDGAAQVVEVDTILMGNLTRSGWVAPVGIPNPGVFPTAWEAASI